MPLPSYFAGRFFKVCERVNVFFTFIREFCVYNFSTYFSTYFSTHTHSHIKVVLKTSHNSHIHTSALQRRLQNFIFHTRSHKLLKIGYIIQIFFIVLQINYNTTTRNSIDSYRLCTSF